VRVAVVTVAAKVVVERVVVWVAARGAAREGAAWGVGLREGERVVVVMVVVVTAGEAWVVVTAVGA
jgi:hypothetical protein